ncbi:murein hydrolase activator EnvC [Paraglaciecola sp.]|uniref:murein hydrolase activator EnvC family protein n=1 Tax=Paraglaciecola sp. TaxID=1920173 RepID=UPI00273D165F|nr:peptidoglycan DD-metalloendopeptidase family protein [Paraglaciecola sp.]MDP5031506.1 peptidoglycan DD-metalloendopeptidase family protein [Paraglaciecola sp.]
MSPWTSHTSMPSINNQFRKTPLLGAFLLLTCFLGSSISWAQQQQDLQAIQEQIKAKKEQVAKQLQEAKKLQIQLERSEVNIANTVKALKKTQAALVDNNNQRSSLAEKRETVQSQVQQQQKGLAKLIKSAYMTGNYDFAKMLLNQRDAANFERTITYYQYLNTERKTKIDEFRLLVSELESVNLQLEQKQAELRSLQVDQNAQQIELTEGKATREATLASIRSAIESDEAKIEILQQNEKSLQDALAKAQREAEKQKQTFAGLGRAKGKLLTPAKGELMRMFGRIRQGQIKWKGIIIKGEVGSAVIAVHQGKVLYADWLRGFGLVTVLDHGDGYMSLYGHNQALLKQAGDIVDAGETIALLGQSGGQSYPNLYFEIRHKGQPVNPTTWLKL